MTDKNVNTGTKGADVKTAPAMPDATKYGTDKAEVKRFNADFKVWRDATYALAHPKTAKSGPAKVYTLADIHETALAMIAKNELAGMPRKDATIKVLQAYANTYHETVRRFEDMLVLARAL